MVHLVMSGRTIGSELGVVLESQDRSTTFVIDAPTAAELDRIEERCRAAIRVEIEPLTEAVRAEPVAVG